MLSPKLNMVSYTSLLGLGGLIFIFAYRRKLCYFLWCFRNRKIIKKEKSIYIISSHQEWEKIADTFCKQAQEVNAVGFDCEWIQVDKRRRPVALLQLATHTGMCVLVRLNILKQHLPHSLREILEDERIAKVGVSCDIDHNFLCEDYNIRVNGWLDLRHLAVRHSQETWNGEEREEEKLGLGALAKRYLGRKMNKDWRVRRGDWEALTMANIQINYAAEDALVGIQVLLCLVTDLWEGPCSSWSVAMLSNWEGMTSQAVEKVGGAFKEVKFSQKNSNDNFKNTTLLTTSQTKPVKGLRTSSSTRKSPLYHNSQLCAPDGEPLCTCDPKKALWYVEKGLGEFISESPLVVRLKFEPAGRPNKEGLDGQFYLQERFNVCVVCGTDDSYIRKNIIPHEYRKYFPEILKSHQSHDVVLLCTKCHQFSNVKDNVLRSTLAKEFNAPIGYECDVKMSVDGRLKAVRSAAGALKKSRSVLPPARIQHLEDFLKDYYQKEVTEELINEAADMDIRIMNSEYIPHAYKVYQHYETVGLIQLEQRWREWFLDTMSPKHLPENWSVSHNHKKLRIKMARFPLDSEVRHDYKIALVGSQGHIDVPYEPNKVRRWSSFNHLNSDEEESTRENTPDD